MYSPRRVAGEVRGRRPGVGQAPSATTRRTTNVDSWALAVSTQLVGVGVEQQVGHVDAGRRRCLRPPATTPGVAARARRSRAPANPDRGRRTRSTWAGTVGGPSSDSDARWILTTLVETEDIKRLKYAYFRCLDQKRWDEMAELFVPDATAAYSGGKYHYEGRDAIVDFMRRNMDRPTPSTPATGCTIPRSARLADTATGMWAMEDVNVDTEYDFYLTGAGFYRTGTARSTARGCSSTPATSGPSRRSCR